MRYKWLLHRLAVVWLVLLVMLAISASVLPIPDPVDVHVEKILLQPGPHSLAGTDELGRDVLSRLIFAARVSLFITACATTLAVTLGALLGTLAGLLGGAVDRVVAFGVDFFWSVPFIVFVVLVVAVVGVTSITLVLTIGLINWVSSARVFRETAIVLKQEQFIRTARAYGFSDWQVAIHHLLPNLRRTMAAMVAYGAVEVMVLESGLAFLGLGLPAPRPTWGGMLAEGLAYFSSAWWLVVAPAMALTLTLASFQVLAHSFELSGGATNE